MFYDQSTGAVISGRERERERERGGGGSDREREKETCVTGPQADHNQLRQASAVNGSNYTQRERESE